MFRPDDGSVEGETIPLRRAIMWVAVWVGLLVGIGLYFRYAQLLVPLLG